MALIVKEEITSEQKDMTAFEEAMFRKLTEYKLRAGGEDAFSYIQITGSQVVLVPAFLTDQEVIIMEYTNENELAVIVAGLLTSYAKHIEQADSLSLPIDLSIS